MAEDESAGVMVPPHTHTYTQRVRVSGLNLRSQAGGGGRQWLPQYSTEASWQVAEAQEKKNEKAKSWLESFSHLLGHIPFP